MEVYGAVAAAARNTGILHNVAASAFRVCGNGTRISSSCDGDASSLYAASTRYDFAFWAAAWAFKATGNATLLADAQEFQASFLLVEAAAGLQCALVVALSFALCLLARVAETLEKSLRFCSAMSRTIGPSAMYRREEVRLRI